jgi:hypothetical protein
MRFPTALASLTFLAIWASFAIALYWSDQLVGARLSSDARLALPAGRYLFIFLPGLFQVLAGRRPPRDTPARIDPAGNRVLQSVWQDAKPALPSWLSHTIQSVAVVVVLALYGVLAFDNLHGAGDRAVGFVAGIGIFTLVAIAYAIAGLAGWKLWQVSRRLLRRPTPAPAP